MLGRDAETQQKFTFQCCWIQLLVSTGDVRTGVRPDSLLCCPVKMPHFFTYLFSLSFPNALAMMTVDEHTPSTPTPEGG